MISKTLEENKEKMELSQKLIMNEKEINTLKAEVRKLTLERERAERKLLQASGDIYKSVNNNDKMLSSSNHNNSKHSIIHNDENVVNKIRRL